jgi:hypothetical protein
MVSLRFFLGYIFSILGAVFFAITVFFIFASEMQTGTSNVIYQYRPLVLPALFSGLVFFNSGLISIWLEYLKFKQRKKLWLKLEIELDKKDEKLQKR